MTDELYTQTEGGIRYWTREELLIRAETAEAEVAALQAWIAELYATIAKRNKTITEREAEIVECHENYYELAARIAEMEAAASASSGAAAALDEKEKIMTKRDEQYEFVAGRHFSCDCGLPWHALYVGPFFGELMDEAELFNSVVTFTVVVEPDSLWERLKGAARMLFGRYDYHEMSISREQWPAFVEHINHIDGACKRTRERYENMRI